MTETAGPARQLQPRERMMLIVLGAVALLAVLYLLVFAGGDDPGPEEPRALPTRTTEPTPSPRPSPLPETDEAFEGRDPFQPLVVAEPPPDPDGGTGDGGTGDAPDLDGDGVPDDTGGPGGDGDGNGDGVPDGENRRITLIDIFTEGGERMATVEVGDSQYTVGEGETFAENYRLLDLTDRCGTFVFGDERFTLCIGQEVRK